MLSSAKLRAVARASQADGVRAALRQVSYYVAFVVVPALVTIGYFVVAVRLEYAFDFHQFWQGARDVLDGRSPYPDLTAIEALPNDGRNLDAHGIQDVFLFPYPAFAAVALLPLGALPFGVASGILTAILLVSVAGGLWLLGVRDWRCYTVVFASSLVLGAVTLGTLTPLLFGLLALAWRYRDRPWIVAAALGPAIALKLFLWPLLLWLVATRRFRAAVASSAAGAALLLGGWATLGFDGIGDYPRLLAALSDAVQAKSFSVTALGLFVGLSDRAASTVALVLAAVLVGLAFRTARGPDGDRRSLTLVLAATLALSPIVWLHYFVLLLVPIALSRPRFSPLWLIPVAFWITPFQENEDALWRFGIVLGLAVLTTAITTFGSIRWSPHAERVAPARP